MSLGDGPDFVANDGGEFRPIPAFDPIDERLVLHHCAVGEWTVHGPRRLHVIHPGDDDIGAEHPPENGPHEMGWTC
jgi:hypothetical protein